MNVKRLLTVLLVAVFALSVVPTVNAQGAVFKGAYPYQVPPVGHLNSFVTNGIPNGIGIYQDLLEPSPAMYLWASGDWQNLLAESWAIDGENWVMKIRQDCAWSDGSPLTAKDVVTTFAIRRLQSATAFQYVDTVTAVDDYTIAFHMFNPSSVMERFILKERIRADATYGEWAARVDELVAAGKTPDDEEWKDLVNEFNEFRPETLLSSGPFTLDLADVTDTQLTLRKNANTCFKDVKFDEVVLYNGETPTVTPLVLSNEVHYATHGFPPATEAQFKEQGIRILRPPIYSGPALYLNHAIHPFELVEFRQALAYAVDRAQNGQISLGESGKAVIYMTGFSDNLLPVWMTQEQMDALNQYEYDPDKAAQMLTDLGFTKGDDGVWVDDQGKKLEFELTVPAEFADWSAAAQNLTDQLNAFGLLITMRGVNFQQHPQDVYDGNFQMAIRDWGAGNPHPSYSYRTDLINYNTNGQGDGRPGMSFPLVQTVNGEEVDLEQLWVDTAAGTDLEAQKAVVAKLAAAYNTLLPQIPIWERYGNNPAFPGLTWPPDDDPIYLNSPYGDSFVVLMILDGRLGPAT